MLSLFRNNQSTTVFLLAIYTVCLRLPALVGWVHPPEKLGEGDGGLLFQSVFGWADKNAFVSAILAAGLVYVQALLVNRLADFYRMMDDRNWLPGMHQNRARQADPHQKTCEQGLFVIDECSSQHGNTSDEKSGLTPKIQAVV